MPDERDSFSCKDDHHYTVVSLALTTNLAALRAIWLAIRALEDDAASLNYMAATYGDHYGMPAERRRSEASAATAAAEMLRGHARRAQQRLESLRTAPAAEPEAGRVAGDAPA